MRSIILLLAGILTFLDVAYAQQPVRELKGWKTNTSIRSIELDELISGGPPKDGIPAISNPSFVSAEAASEWLDAREPVILLAREEVARAYPLQILTWHEIVNDEVAGVPVVVTFCPLCYAALAFDRRLDGKTYSFGVSGMLRHSDMIMFDRETETLWQQLSGEAVVGDLTGKILTPLPAQIVSFEQFRTAYPEGEVLSKDTGHRRDYGRNPYVGYDDIDERPFLYRGPIDERVPPMEKLVTVSIDGVNKAYPHAVTRKMKVLHDEVNGRPLVIFHSKGAVSALDKSVIKESKNIGTTGVFEANIDGTSLTFSHANGVFVDAETGSTWDITGRALDGHYRGRQLEPVPHGNFFAFAWFAFKPDTALYNSDD